MSSIVLGPDDRTEEKSGRGPCLKGAYMLIKVLLLMVEEYVTQTPYFPDEGINARN